MKAPAIDWLKAYNGLDFAKVLVNETPSESNITAVPLAPAFDPF